MTIDTPNDSPDGPGNVVQLTGAAPSADRGIRLRADTTVKVDALLADARAILSEFRLKLIGPEVALRIIIGSKKSSEHARSFKSLRASHARSRFYVVELLHDCLDIANGEKLLVAPAAKLRSMGLCIAAFTDDRKPELCIFVAGRDWGGMHTWVLSGANLMIEPAGNVLALHSVLGALKEPLPYDETPGWVTEAPMLLSPLKCLWTGVNPSWRPAS